MYIKITNYGKELIIQKYGYDYFESVVESNKQENGYYCLQCHQIMSYFGEHLFNGCKMPFEPTVYFDKQELDFEFAEGGIVKPTRYFCSNCGKMEQSYPICVNKPLCKECGIYMEEYN